MKHVGIITEYNPFHNGHAYQLEKVHQLFPEKKCMVIMSGNYVQRGEPAIWNKYLRTECALASGADILFELPLLGAVSSAEHFATTAVLSLYKTGIIDTLCFGAETDDISILTEIADVLACEPSNYQKELQAHLKRGESFPKARANALASHLQNITELEQIIEQPNNILAIEYLKAIKRYHLDITPVIIKRVGSGYHDTTLDSTFSSASAIRNCIVNNTQDWTTFVPDATRHIIASCEYAKPLFISDFYQYLQYAIWRDNSNLETVHEISTDLANRIRNIRHFPQTYRELLDLLKNRNYTVTRLQRAMLNLVLGVTKSEINEHKQLDYTPYLRLLGFSGNSSFLLKDMKKVCLIPVINKVADANQILSDTQMKLFQAELHRNRLYEQIFYNKYGIPVLTEQEHTVIISE